MVLSFSAKCAACGAKLKSGDIGKVYPQRMEEPRATHVTYSNGSPQVCSLMTRVYGVTRHDDEGNPIQCHADQRQQAAPQKAAPKPSASSGMDPESIKALVAQTVKASLEAILTEQKPKRSKKST
jgi:hypothetical protein